MAEVALPQVLLGAESQLLAYAAGLEGAFFASFPEMFGDGGRLPAGAVHLRFGGVRSVRVLKGASNVCVLAERAGPDLLTASHHPFASGRVVPAAVERVVGLCEGAVGVTRMGGGAVPCSLAPPGLVALQVPSGRPRASGLEVASLADFKSDAWAAGTARRVMPPAGADCVLVAWNMDHPGSIVPALLERLAALGAGAPAVVLLPFNYVGQTGIIRDLIARLSDGGGFLAQVFIARVHALAGVAALRRIARVAWVDGNDPEHWWTVGRLEASGIAALLLDAGHPSPALPSARLPLDETAWVEAETRCGALTFAAAMPAWRSLPALLAQTAQLGGPKRASRSA